jgi:hypothetical protein
MIDAVRAPFPFPYMKRERERSCLDMRTFTSCAKKDTPMPGIDFKRVRQEITMEQVLKLIGFEPTQRKGDQWYGTVLVPYTVARPLLAASAPMSSPASTSAIIATAQATSLISGRR